MSKDRVTMLYKSEEARARVMKLVESAHARWPDGSDGEKVERLSVPTAAGTTAVFAFGARNSGARPLILLHGAGSSSTMWIADAAALGRGRRCFAVDIPGEPGMSEERRLPWTAPAVGLWLDEVVAALGLGAKGGTAGHDLLGLSIGGWIGLAYATRSPQALGSLALLCPSGLGHSRSSFMWKAIFAMARGHRGLESLSRSLYGNIQPPEGAISAGTLVAESTNSRMETPRLFSDAEIERITSPILLVVGEKDGLLRSAESAERLRSLKSKAEVHILKGAGHALTGQGLLVADFLDRH